MSIQTRRVAAASALTAVVGASIFSAFSAAPAWADTWKSFKALKFYASDEVDADAAVYISKGHFLVDPSNSDYVYLLNPKQYTVFRAEEDAVVPDGVAPTVSPTDTELWSKIGVLDKTGPALSWEDDAGRYAISAKPPLLGETSIEDLRAYTDKYEYDIEEYTPDTEFVTTLSEITVPTHIVVGFGLWCSVCAEWLPRFVKTIEVADNEHISVTYVSINEDLDRPAELLDTYSIDQVPTFIVRQDDSEIGRIDPDTIEYESDPKLEKMLIDALNVE